MVLPPSKFPPKRSWMRSVRWLEGRPGVGTVGLINLQLAYKEGKVYMLEEDPAREQDRTQSLEGDRRTAREGRDEGLGRTLKELGLKGEADVRHYAVKASVFPFLKLPGVHILGPEMRSTGEVMGIDRSYPAAVWKAFTAAGYRLPRKGNIFLSVCDKAEAGGGRVGRCGSPTWVRDTRHQGTAAVLRSQGIEARTVYTISERSRTRSP